MKMSVDQAFRNARTALKDGDREQAETIYRAILERFPANRRIQAELDALSRPQIVRVPDAALDAVIGLYEQGRVAQALDQAAELLTRYPNSEILNNITGGLAAHLGRLETALGLYDKALALAPDYVEALSNRGNALRELKRMEAALADYDAALKLKPDYVEAHVNRGIALKDMDRAKEALASYDRAIRLNPRLAESYNNRGNVLQSLFRLDDALADYETALKLRPDYLSAHINRGSALRAVRRAEAAVASYDSALSLAPKNPDAHHGRGMALKNLRRLDEALSSQRKALVGKPDHVGALGEALNLQARLAVWRDKGAEVALSHLTPGSAGIPPFHMLNVADDPARQLACAKAWTAKHYDFAGQADFASRIAGDKIRIGYFSADFHNHATMYLIARLFELHDRRDFEIHAFSYGPDARDEMRQRLLSAVDAFHDVSSMPDADIAALAREQRIDIAVDLKGHTEDSRTGLFAHRAAPVQVAWLGYPGTSGADFIDYIVADAVTIPESSRQYYSEQILYMPHSYQVNDDLRRISDAPVSRAEAGLPEAGFVFCCFNNIYKISPAEFDIWMRLLAQVEGSVLWLMKDNMWAAANLAREAEARGIDPARIVFAELMPLPEHLARYRLADLFLDTFKVNAHTTASDALWAGLPVLTRLGESFVARVAGSLLQAMDLPELITESVEAYETLALELARDPVKVTALKARVAANRLTSPLFDTARYVRDLEQLYRQTLNRDDV